MQVLSGIKIELFKQRYFADEPDEIAILRTACIKSVNFSCQSGIIKTDYKTAYARR